MRENNVTQTALAKAIGFSQRAVSKWVNAETEPTESAIKACADYFEVSTDEILGIAQTFRQNALNSEEIALLNSYKQLNKSNKARLLSYLQFVLEEQKR